MEKIDLQRLTGAATITEQVWSRDLSKIGYNSPDGFSIVDIDTGSSTLITDMTLTMGQMAYSYFSPDGTRIVYNTDEGFYLSDVMGRGPVEMSRLNTSSFPLWASDSSRIVYRLYLDSEHRYELYVADADGSNRRLLSEEVRSTSASPSWSPDSVHLAYGIGSGAAGADRRIVIADVESGAQTRIDHGLVSTLWFWSPDGANIAYEDKVGLSVANASGEDRRPIATLYWAHPFWSPDGSRVAFNDDDGMVVTDSDGRNRTQVSPMHFEAIGWSLDSTKIAYSDRQGSGLFVANADGSDNTKIAHAIASYESSVGWMADGNTIIYTVRSPGE